MFDLVRNNKKFIQIVLAFIMLPFALWGVDSYVRTGGGDGVAKVGDSTISVNEFQQSMRDQAERLRAQFGDKVDQEMLDSPQLRQQVLQDLINQRLLALHAANAKLRVSDETLVGFITSVPSLQENGKFSRERYQSLVAAQGMSIEMFESRVRQDLVMQQSMLAAGNAAVSGRMPADRWLAAQLEERAVSEAILRVEQFVEGKPDAAAVKRYYEENRSKFEKPEQVRVAYVVLNQDKIAAETKVDEAAVKAHYQSREAQYKQAEQRQASHILFRVDAKASDADVKAAEEKATNALNQLKAGGDFAKLAKQFSQDPGSAEKGGDLGYFGRGMMVKPFEDTVFGLTANQLSGLVRSDFGFHIIKLTGIRSERVRPLEEVRAEIVADLKRQAAAKSYAEAAEGFGNTVYEQADSLKPAADKFGLQVQETSWLSARDVTTPPLNHPKLVKAIFAEDAIKNRRNTESVDVGNSMLVAARVTDHRPASVEPLESVTATIEKVLSREAALKKATVAGQEKLAKLQNGEKTDLAWGTIRNVSRLQASQLPEQARGAIFGVSTKTLPAYAGVEAPAGYVIYRIEKVKPYATEANASAGQLDQMLRQQYAQMTAQEEMAGWLAVLRQRYPVTINTAMLERK